MHISQPLQWKGEINRRDYLIWGLILFTIKYNLDRLIAFQFNKSWYFADYFIQADRLSVGDLSADDRQFYLVLLAQSLPFIWFGTVLCVKRLRSAKLPPWLVIFFFIPFLNFLLFIILAALPERDLAREPRGMFWARLIPKSRWGSAFFSLGLVIISSLLLTLFFINFLASYGWSLFVGIPFFLGFGSVLIYGYHNRLNYAQALGVMLSSNLFFSLVIFILAFEGLVCLVMAFPIMILISTIGATIGYAIHDSSQKVSLQILSLPFALIPILGLLEIQSPSPPPLYPLKTSLIVEAGPQEVWDELVAFSHIDAPKEWLFKTGIAYPIHAEIQGSGVGAIRHCNFTTGAFVEPITTWDEPRLLAFSVQDQPPPMVEWSIYEDIHMEHLDGYFRSEKGQFLLTELPDGRTHLEGTTWYRHDIWPSFYWRWWSDFILHQIHYRVLKHIRDKAESSS